MSSIFQFEHVSFLYEMLRTAFGGIEWFLAAYLLCLAVFFIISRETLSIGFLYPFLFMLITIFNPFLIVPLAEKIGLITRIRRLFWLFPVNLVLAYSFTALCFLRVSFKKSPAVDSLRKRLPSVSIVRPLLAVLCAAFVVSAGTSMKPHLLFPQNIYKTSNTVLEVSRLIEEDAARTGLEKVALYSSQQLIELRQYDASIRSVLRRNDLLDWNLTDTSDETIQKVIDSGHHLHRLALVSRFGAHIDQKAFLKSARKCKVNYIITHTDMELGGYYTDAGYEKIGTAGDFEIYRISL